MYQETNKLSSYNSGQRAIEGQGKYSSKHGGKILQTTYEQILTQGQCRMVQVIPGIGKTYCMFPDARDASRWLLAL